MLFGGIWAVDSCNSWCNRHAQKARDDYGAQEKKRQQETAEAIAKTKETWAYRRQARETVRRGRLEELRNKPSEALIKEASLLLGTGERKDFCATYPYLTILQERDADRAAKNFVTAIRAREKSEMAKDRDGVTKKFCLCEDGFVDSVAEYGRSKGGCCLWGTHGPKISDVLHPTDRADCRGLDNVTLP